MEAWKEGKSKASLKQAQEECIWGGSQQAKPAVTQLLGGHAAQKQRFTPLGQPQKPCVTSLAKQPRVSKQAGLLGHARTIISDHHHLRLFPSM